MLSPITSRENDKIKQACRLRDADAARRQAGLFFAEGPKLCLEAAKACRCLALYATRPALEHTPALASLDAVTIPVSDPVADKLSSTKNSQGVFGLFALPVPAPALLAAARRILALECVQDPGNVGTLIRSAAAFGFDAVLLGPGCAAPYSPRTLRASMGAAVRMPVFETADLPAALGTLRARGMTCLAAALRGAVSLDAAGRNFPGGVCVVIGSEGQGLTDAAIDACDRAVRIPMTDLAESLNAAVAGSVLLWHFRGVGG
ncbi:RNA methyltransferase [uncultured Gemmiger sp.]|uniref:TrmH family RNA methyltransferase n=1 Tax=uncultured Gemmiger sp. TaxID=1623490 RepID=UPI0025D22813|nr:RNA methyltransferase [uncultured Gemmiger sp.]